MTTVFVAVGALLTPLVLAPPPLKATHSLNRNNLPPSSVPFDYRDHLREHILPQMFYFRSHAMFRRAHASQRMAGGRLLVHEAPARRHDIPDALWLLTSSEDQPGEDEPFDLSSQDVPVEHTVGQLELQSRLSGRGVKRFRANIKRSQDESPRSSAQTEMEKVAVALSSAIKDKLMYTDGDGATSSRDDGGLSNHDRSIGLTSPNSKVTLLDHESGLVLSQERDNVSLPNRSSSGAQSNPASDGKKSNQKSGLLNKLASNTASVSDSRKGASFVDEETNDKLDLDFDLTPPSTSTTSSVPLSDHENSRVGDRSQTIQSDVSGRTVVTAIQDSDSRFSQATGGAPAESASTNNVLLKQRNPLAASNHPRTNGVLKQQAGGVGGQGHADSGGAAIPAGGQRVGASLSSATAPLLANGADKDVALSKVPVASKGGQSGSQSNAGTRVVLSGQSGGVLKNPSVQDKPRPPEKSVIHREINLDHRPLEGLPQLMDEVEQKFAEMGEVVDPNRAQQLSKVMAAWDAHRKKVEEGLGLDEADDMADRRPALQTTTPSVTSTFQLFGRRVVGRSWRRITSRLFPDSLKKMLLIFPGTIWCGAGNKANNDTDRLGAHNETDACCREHDLNSDYIAAGQVAPDYGNIHNKYSFTMSSCESDLRFRECLLRNVAGNGSDSSEAVGYLYFTIIKPKCFTKAPGTSAASGNCTEAKERCGRSLGSESESTEWAIRENPDFPEPDPRNRLLDAVLAALSTIRYLFPRGLAESSGSIPLFG